MWMHQMDTENMYREKAWRQLHKNATSYVEQILEVTSYKITAIQPPTTHL